MYMYINHCYKMFQHIHTGEFLHENHHMLYVHLKEELPDCLTAEAFFVLK